ncbi:MAG: hypothetical protein AB8F95_10060 [Bacteroidia bacterium]
MQGTQGFAPYIYLMTPQALIIHTPEQESLARHIAQQLPAWQAKAIAIDAPLPATVPTLLMPLLSEQLLADWEDSKLGEWAMESLDDSRVRLIPILGSECEWEDSIFFGLPLLPQARVPVDNPRFWNQEKALTQLKEDLNQLLAPPAPIKKGGFKRAALRFAWKNMPGQWKWIVRIASVSFIAFLIWLFL